MTLKQWLYSSYPNPYKDGHFGLLHILTLVFIAAFVVVSTIFLRKSDAKSKRRVLFVLAIILIFFEVARRVINLCKTPDMNSNQLLKTLLPRPGCAISVWLVFIAVIVNKKFFYNFASIIGILCAFIFFVYPEAGYNNQYMLFENVYSIVTHTVFLAGAICFITYGFTDFDYKEAGKELISLAVLLVYTFLEIYVLKTEPDPFYFMPKNEVQEIIGMSYALYLPCYLVFIVAYIGLFYFIKWYKEKKKNFVA